MLYTQKQNCPTTTEKNPDLENLHKKIDEELQWLSYNQNATLEEIDQRQNDFMEYIKTHSVPEGTPPPDEPIQTDQDEGVRVEEVD